MQTGRARRDRASVTQRPLGRRRRLAPSQDPEPDSVDAGAGVPAALSRLGAAVVVLGPTTVITGLLFWFGYVATQARFGYFGLTLDVVDLSTTELLLYGVEVVYVPLVAAAVAALVAVVVHASVTWVLHRPEHDAMSRWIGALAILTGVLMLVRAAVGVLLPGAATAEYPGATPLLIALGPVAIGYGLWVLRRVDLRRPRPDGESSWFATPTAERCTQVLVACIAALLVTGLFWAINTFAAAYGTGRGELQAQHLTDDPEVVVETADRLLDLPPGVAATETMLKPADGEIYRYRYRGLRLLAESGGRLFLVPAPWQPGEGRTIVIAYNERVRLAFLP